MAWVRARASAFVRVCETCEGMAVSVVRRVGLYRRACVRARAGACVCANVRRSVAASAADRCWRHSIQTHAGCCIARPHVHPGADACQRARLVPVVARCAVLCCAVRCCTSPVASRARGLGAHRPPCAQWPPLWRRRRLPATQTQEHARSIAHHPGCSGHARTISMEFYGRRAASLWQRSVLCALVLYGTLGTLSRSLGHCSG